MMKKSSVFFLLSFVSLSSAVMITPFFSNFPIILPASLALLLLGLKFIKMGTLSYRMEHPEAGSSRFDGSKTSIKVRYIGFILLFAMLILYLFVL